MERWDKVSVQISTYDTSFLHLSRQEGTLSNNDNKMSFHEEGINT